MSHHTRSRLPYLPARNAQDRLEQQARELEIRSQVSAPHAAWFLNDAMEPFKSVVVSSAPSSPAALSPCKAPKAPVAPLTLDGTRLRTLVAKSMGFAIDATGLTITAPRWVTIGDIENAIAEKQRWILSKLIKWQTRVEQRAPPKVERRDEHADAQQIKDRVTGWLQGEATRNFSEQCWLMPQNVGLRFGPKGLLWA